MRLGVNSGIPARRVSGGTAASLFAGVLVLGAAAVSGQQPEAREEHVVETVEVAVPEGRITVALPADAAAGDRLAGTVRIEAASDRPRRRARQESALRGYVIETPEGSVTAGAGVIEVVAPATEVMRVVVRQPDGEVVGSADVPLDSAPEGPGMTDYELPELIQTGGPLALTGIFDGDLETTGVTFSGESIELLAESPRQVVVAPIDGPVGRGELRLEEGETVVTALARLVAVALSADTTALRSGQATGLELRVSGLEGLDEPLRVRLENHSPGVVSLAEGEEVLVIPIPPDDVAQDGTFTFTTTLRGIGPGAFDLSATVE